MAARLPKDTTTRLVELGLSTVKQRTQDFHWQIARRRYKKAHFVVAAANLEPVELLIRLGVTPSDLLALVDTRDSALLEAIFSGLFPMRGLVNRLLPKFTTEWAGVNRVEVLKDLGVELLDSPVATGRLLSYNPTKYNYAQAIVLRALFAVFYNQRSESVRGVVRSHSEDAKKWTAGGLEQLETFPNPRFENHELRPSLHLLKYRSWFIQSQDPAGLLQANGLDIDPLSFYFKEMAPLSGIERDTFRRDLVDRVIIAENSSEQLSIEDHVALNLRNIPTCFISLEMLLEMSGELSRRLTWLLSKTDMWSEFGTISMPVFHSSALPDGSITYELDSLNAVYDRTPIFSIYETPSDSGIGVTLRTEELSPEQAILIRAAFQFVDEELQTREEEFGVSLQGVSMVNQVDMLASPRWNKLGAPQTASGVPLGLARGTIRRQARRP